MADTTTPAKTEIPQRVKIVNGRHVPEFPGDCEPHTDSPDGYLQWDAWAEKMDRAHVQRQCSGCGLWAIWEPKDGTPGNVPASTSPSAHT